MIARNALLAATVAVESLMHVDDNFSREYCLEKLEHNLENMPALTAYPRLAIGPQQRFGAEAGDAGADGARLDRPGNARLKAAGQHRRPCPGDGSA